MKIKLDYKYGVCILEPHGKLIGAGVLDLRILLKTEIISAETPRILINLEHVSRMDSAALGLLVSANRTVKQKHGRIGVVHVGRHIKNLIIRSRLINIFEHFKTETVAVKELSRETSIARPYYKYGDY